MADFTYVVPVVHDDGSLTFDIEGRSVVLKDGDLLDVAAWAEEDPLDGNQEDVDAAVELAAARDPRWHDVCGGDPRQLRRSLAEQRAAADMEAERDVARDIIAELSSAGRAG